MVEVAFPREEEIVRYFILLCAILLWSCQKENRRVLEREIPRGYSGEARLNPYLAAELYLKEKGWAVESSRIWSQDGRETSVVFMPVSFLQTQGMGMRVLTWVQQGGTLILSVEGGEQERNDFRVQPSRSQLPEKGDFSGMDYLFEELGVEVKRADWSPFSDSEAEAVGHLSQSWHITKLREDLAVPGMPGLPGLQLEQEGVTGLSAAQAKIWDFEHEGLSRVIGVSHGTGEVIVMAHARPLRSPYLARADHAKFLEMIAHRYAGEEPGEMGRIVFLYGSQAGFFGLLWREGWMCVLAGLVFLLCWLWKKVPRFGPLLQDSHQSSQSLPYRDSLQASARYLWRRGKINHLIAPLRARIMREHQGDPASFYDRLAESSQLSREEIVKALTQPVNKDPGQVLKMVQKIQSLLK